MPERRVLRAASARDIARVLGCSKRTLLRWAALGCPHDEVVRRGQPSASFDLEEVRAWMVKQGLDARHAVGGDEGAARQGAPVAPKRRTGGTGSGTGGGAAGGVDQQQDDDENGGEKDLWSLTFRKPVSDLDLLGPLNRLLKSVDDAIQGLTKGATPAELQKIGSAMSDISTQFRAIRQAEFEHQKRMGAFVPLADARRVIGEHASAFVFDLKQIEADLPEKVANALVEARILPGDGDTVARARRVLTPVVGDAIAKARERRAAAATAAADAGARAVA